MKYKTPSALEAAVKQAAKDSPQDTNRAITGFYFHRLLCRVFDGGNDEFVLKGGQGMLARTIGARATRDIDLLSLRESLDDALTDLLRLVQKNLGDFVSFEFVGSTPIKEGDNYRSGLSVKFIPFLGAKRMQGISIDLVVDEVPLDRAQRLSPADRIDVAGIKTCDYLVYPVTAALSDKFCALHERYGAKPTSRVKDLVDITIYASTCDIEGTELEKRPNREISVRKLGKITSFSLPREWGNLQGKSYEQLARQTGLPNTLLNMSSAEKLACNLFDPALIGKCAGLQWGHELLTWIH